MARKLTKFPYGIPQIGLIGVTKAGAKTIDVPGLLATDTILAIQLPITDGGVTVGFIGNKYVSHTANSITTSAGSNFTGGAYVMITIVRDADSF